MNGKTLVSQLASFTEPLCPHSIHRQARIYCEWCIAEAIDAAIREAVEEDQEACCRAIRAACGMCNGTGGENVPGGYVTRDMALDAGDPALEGQPLPYQQYECEYCGRPIEAIREHARSQP